MTKMYKQLHLFGLCFKIPNLYLFKNGKDLKMVSKSSICIYLKMEKFVIIVTLYSRLPALCVSVKSVHLVAERLDFIFGRIIQHTSKIVFAASR